MEKVIRNNWKIESGAPFAITKILDHAVHPEGLDIYRIHFFVAGNFMPEAGVGHIISVIHGSAIFYQAEEPDAPLFLSEGVHLYVPAGQVSVLTGDQGTELICVSGATAEQARGKKLILRDERFLAACAIESQSLRWTFTPQYLSRRVFLHHDPVLLSKSGNPVSWFRTTMFDVAGLPHNEEGEPVFKMSYNSRTECNVCYEVQGAARVRMAQHPYAVKKQVWDPWLKLDSDATYHLNESVGTAEEENSIDDVNKASVFLRNKHEVSIADGHVTLCCLFDPAPTGIERHCPGEYSDYEPLSQLIGTDSYQRHQREIAKFDQMVDQLSLAKASGRLSDYYGSQIWKLYEQGRNEQIAIESGLIRQVAVEDLRRVPTLADWMQKPVLG